MRVAALYDVHGNLPALEAVLADVERLRIDEIVCLGDVVQGGTEPAQTLDRLGAADVRRFWKDNYVQNRMCVSIVGDVDPEIVGLGAVLGPPDLPQQLALGHEPALVLGQHAEEVELDRG